MDIPNQEKPEPHTTQPSSVASAQLLPASGMEAEPPPLNPSPPEIKEQPKRGRVKSVLSTIAILLIAPLIAVFITAFVFQSYEVDGQSMETTLHDNDRLIIWKVARTWSRLTNHDYIPKRGDVVVFVKKGLYELNSSQEKQLIKRVIALPGERVTVKDGVVTVYNQEHPEGFLPDRTLAYGNLIPAITEGNVDIVVPAGEVFLCGDNRGNSYDSRSFGPIPARDIIGKLAARILPLSDAEKF